MIHAGLNAAQQALALSFVLFNSARCCWKGELASQAEPPPCRLPIGALLSPAYQERTQSLSLLFLDEIQMSPGRV